MAEACSNRSTHCRSQGERGAAEKFKKQNPWRRRRRRCWYRSRTKCVAGGERNIKEHSEKPNSREKSQRNISDHSRIGNLMRTLSQSRGPDGSGVLALVYAERCRRGGSVPGDWSLSFVGIPALPVLLADRTLCPTFHFRDQVDSRASPPIQRASAGLSSAMSPRRPRKTQQPHTSSASYARAERKTTSLATMKRMAINGTGER